MVLIQLAELVIRIVQVVACLEADADECELLTIEPCIARYVLATSW